MKVSYEERLAIDFGLRRRCDEGNNVVLSIRAGGNAGQLLSSEIITSVCRPCPDRGKATSQRSLLGKIEADTAESVNLCMRGNPKRENREIPSASSPPWWRGAVGEGLRPYVRHARRWEVRWSHSTYEANEQSRNVGGGVRGGKGITQGKCRTLRTCTGRSAGIRKATSRAATARRDRIS